MFGSNKALKAENTKLVNEVEELIEDRNVLKTRIETQEKRSRQLEHEHKMAEEDIRHMVKIDQTRKDLELQKEKQNLEAEFNQKLTDAHSEYRDKVESMLHAQSADLKEMYAQILERLPNVSMSMKQYSKEGQ